jgi:hypothetical protein
MERPYRGFRSSSLGGAGETDLLKVCAFEMQEMGNKDLERWDFKGGEWKLLSEIPDGKLIAYNRLPSIT